MSDKIVHHTAFTPQGAFVGEFSRGVKEYQNEWQEGPTKCSFVFEADTDSADLDVNASGLRNWFERRIMWNIKAEFEGVIVWDGFIWELELDLDNTYFIKSMKDMANAITVSYSDGLGSTVYLEDDDGNLLWVTNEESIIQYGRREKVININSESGTEALERANAEIKYLASPYTLPPVWRSTKNKRLTVSCVGRSQLANNIQLIPEQLRLTPAHTAANVVDSDTYVYANETIVSAEILRIVEIVQDVAGWLYPLNISADNETVTKMGVPNGSGAWDRILELSQLRDKSETFYRLSVQPDGGVIYLPFDETPNYFYKSEPGRIEYADGTQPTWRARPGIVRVVDSQIGPALPDTWLSDRRNIFAYRTTMRDTDEFASFHGKEYSVAEYYNRLDSNFAWVKRKTK